MQQWLSLSDPATEEAPHDVPLYCELAKLDAGITRLPDESTILRSLSLPAQTAGLRPSDNGHHQRKPVCQGLMFTVGTVADDPR